MTRWKAWGVAAMALVMGCAPAGSAIRAGDGAAGRRDTGVAAPSAPRTAEAPRSAPTRPKIPRGTTAGYVVIDRQTNKTVLHRASTRRFRSASVIKILIAIDFLESAKRVSAADARRLAIMLRSSDDRAASELWRRGGQRKIVQRMARKIGLRDTAPPPASLPGYWGYSSLSARDVARTYRYLLERADRKVAKVILGHLRKATKCGTDGFDQSFGIPSATPRPWAVKQGWSGFGTTPPVRCVHGASAAPAVPVIVPAAGAPAAVPAKATGAAAKTDGVPDLGRPVLYTTGLVGENDRLIMVVLTAHPAGSSWSASVKRITTLNRQLHRAALPRR